VLNIDTFSKAIALIYDASMDVVRWNEALAFIAGMLSSDKAQISYARSAVDPRTFVQVWGIDEDVLRRVMPKYLALGSQGQDPRATPTRYKAVHCRQIVTEALLRTSEMYQQVLAPAGIEYSMYFVVPVEQDFMCALSVMRGPQQAAFTADDCTDFGRLAPHVSRAVNMHGTFQSYRDELAKVKALLDDVPLGMMVVGDDELKVANRTARELLEEGDPLRVSGGELRGATRQADAALRDAIHEAQSGGDLPIGLALPIDHADPVRAVVRRMRPEPAGMLGAREEAVALYVADPRRPLETSEEVLQRLFGLTPREAAVLRVLADGGSLRTAAQRLHISHETVRSHVKHIMETTGARRQADLVRMVLASPAWLAGRSPDVGSRAPLPKVRPLKGPTEQ
jgi:DNA-binding CsgD family transcriptional regulator